MKRCVSFDSRNGTRVSGSSFRRLALRIRRKNHDNRGRRENQPSYISIQSDRQTLAVVRTWNQRQEQVSRSESSTPTSENLVLKRCSRPINTDLHYTPRNAAPEIVFASQRPDLQTRFLPRNEPVNPAPGLPTDSGRWMFMRQQQLPQQQQTTHNTQLTA